MLTAQVYVCKYVMGKEYTNISNILEHVGNFPMTFWHTEQGRPCLTPKCPCWTLH